jgi:hypothetical protein
MSMADWEKLKDRSPVRVQWDPERNIHLEALLHRSIQIGLGPAAVELYIDKWIQRIADVTELAHTIHATIAADDTDRAASLLPVERPYPYSGRAR